MEEDYIVLEVFCNCYDQVEEEICSCYVVVEVYDGCRGYREVYCNGDEEEDGRKKIYEGKECCDVYCDMQVEIFCNWVLSGGEGFCNGGFYFLMSNFCYEFYDQYVCWKIFVDFCVQIYDECFYGIYDYYDFCGGQEIYSEQGKDMYSNCFQEECIISLIQQGGKSYWSICYLCCFVDFFVILYEWFLFQIVGM